MATNYKLTPIYRNGLLQRWRKKDKRLTLAGLSNPWYFPASKTETKEQSYRRAWAAWKEVEKQLVAATLPPIYSVRANVNFAYEPPSAAFGRNQSWGWDWLRKRRSSLMMVILKQPSQGERRETLHW